ncbi:MAG: hypothetical protein LAT84_13065 [Balneolia bacterium]|nr:hypothetical protein [Balneolia bacterium]
MSFEFYKTRSVSDVIVDSLQFTKQHFRPLLKKSVPLLIAYGIVILFVNIFTTGAVLGQFGSTGMMSQSGLDMAFVWTSLASFVSYLFIFAIMLLGLLWVRHSFQNNTEAEFDLGYQLKKYFPGFVMLAIVYGVSVFIGALFLVVPGIYLFIALYGTYGAYIIEREGVIESLKRGHELSKGSWWFILGTIVLMYILTLGINLLAGLPALALGFLMGGGHEMFVSDGDFSLGFFLFVLFSTISGLVNFLFYGVWGIFMGLLYFTLRERKEGDSIADEMSAFESELSEESFGGDAPQDDSFSGTDSDPDSDRNNPDWR